MRIFRNPENGIFFKIGFRARQIFRQVEDGGLSCGDVYITRSWEEGYWGPGWILPHRWQDPGLGFWGSKNQNFQKNQTFPKNRFWALGGPGGPPIFPITPRCGEHLRCTLHWQFRSWDTRSQHDANINGVYGESYWSYCYSCHRPLKGIPQRRR